MAFFANPVGPGTPRPGPPVLARAGSLVSSRRSLVKAEIVYALAMLLVRRKRWTGG
jgi:hypothetical protein